METNHYRNKDLKRERRVVFRALCHLIEKKLGELPQEKGNSPMVFETSQDNAFGQIRSPSSQGTKLAVCLSVCSLWNHEPSKVQMDDFLEYNLSHTSPYVTKASTFRVHSYHVNILGPHA